MILRERFGKAEPFRTEDGTAARRSSDPLRLRYAMRIRTTSLTGAHSGFCFHNVSSSIGTAAVPPSVRKGSAFPSCIFEFEAAPPEA